MGNAENEVIKVYVGTDPNMKKAEIALEQSIHTHTKSKVEIIWMNYAHGGLWGDWNIGREHGKPYADVGWATDFSCFRFAIPEANGFEGRAIYVDVDMILLKDIKELFNYPMGAPVLIPPTGFDVILFNCEAFKNLPWWPSIEEMKKSGKKINDYGRLLAEHNMLGLLSPDWNCCDGKGYDPINTGLLHFTNMRTQPWKPYPDVFEYPPHPRPDMVALWQKYYDEGVAELEKKK
jgi:hypothetical protein